MTVSVRSGLAEQLARLAHFADLDLPEVQELDAVACFLIGDVGDATAKTELWEQLKAGDAARLWYLISDDWDDRDLDDAIDTDAGLTREQEEQARYERTRNRLCSDIERTVYLARYRAAEARRGTAGQAAVQTLLSAR
ncbi:hypothetical protein [Blastococcus sp. CT_GayMR16]|uniref:hypothetical protein n=1 Tax=Blastococcus sp. CT_GayMR16 TaxID=2559607 RepID=UPI0010743847|nr:hypothetical protein [Blastococcus sp. CT_GayMR16]TFV91375.1 hypothetical protein E4P38_01960 [Blastococcus sp. CT_GayMR16]